jgi:PAS domain S-box-containing protein
MILIVGSWWVSELTESDIYAQNGNEFVYLGFNLIGIARGVTERKRTEEALRESEERVRTILDSVRSGIVIIEVETQTIVDANPAATQMMGITRDELIGTVCHEHLCPAEVGKCPILDLGMNVDNSERILRTVDGVETPILKTVSRVTLGGKEYLLESFVDISERKRVEESLRQSEEKYRTILENIQDGYYEVDLSGNFTFFNKSLCKALGYSEDKLMGMNYRAYVDDEVARTVYQTFNTVYSTRKPTEIFDWEIMREDGITRLVEASVSLIVDSTDEPVGFQGIVRDISERKKAENALRGSEKRYKELINMLPQGVIITDLNESITLVNQEMCIILGYSSEELIGRSLLNFIDIADTKKVLAQTKRRTRGEISSYDIRTNRKTGEIRDVRVTAAPMKNNAGEVDGSIGVFMDVTDSKQNEEQRRQQHSELEVYASLLRHDLRNDVGVILGNVDLAKMIAGENDSEIRETLSSTEAVCERMMNLLKAVSRPADSIERNIVALVRSVSSQAQDAHAKLTVNVTVDDDTEELTIVGNRLFPMVFENLLRNAAAHAGENSIVDMTISKEGSNVQVLVSDNGPGVPKEVRNHLFHREVSTSGGGLGLYLSRAIVNAMNGSIELMDTDPGKGATFKILLPLTM